MTTRTYYAWAAVSKKSGKVLRDFRGHYAVYTDREHAQADCPRYGEVRRIALRLRQARKRGQKH